MMGYVDAGFAPEEPTRLAQPRRILWLVRDLSLVLISGFLGFLILRVFEPIRIHERLLINDPGGIVLFCALGLFTAFLLRRRDFIKMMSRLTESESRFEKLFHGAADSMMVSTPGGRILNVNDQVATSLGYLPEEIIGKRVHDFADGFLPEDNPGVWERLVGGERVLMRGTAHRKNGESYPVESYVTLSEVDGRYLVLSSIRDVTEREAMLEELRVSNERSEAFVRAMPDAVCRIDADGNYLDVQSGDQRRLYRRREAVLSSSVREILGAEAGERFMEKVALAIETREVQTVEYRFVADGGEERVIESRIVAVGEEAIYFARDVTERSEMISRINDSESRSRALIESIPDLIFRFDRKGRNLELHSPADGRIVAHGGDIVGKLVSEVLPEDAAREYIRAIEASLATDEMQVFEYEIETTGGLRSREGRMVKSGTDEVICFVRDVSERREFEDRIRTLAYSDELTKLPNRIAFMENLNVAMSDGNRRPTAVLLLSLRDFAKINSSLGREAGDRLLELFADQGRASLEGWHAGKAMFSRFSGNEFATLIEDAGREEIESLIRAAIGRYRKMPFRLNDVEVYLKAKIGVAMIEPTDDVSVVMRRVSVALREAKRDPDSVYEIYDEAMGERAALEVQLEADLRHAIEYGDIRVCYQPEVFLGSGRIYSLEALARWRHPTLGEISPARFIPLAEETGLILPLGEYVLAEACREMSRWCGDLPDLAPCTVSVNVSALQLRQTGFVEKVKRILGDNRLSPERLQVEITESAAVEDIDSSLRIFSELRSMGVHVVLDDFGTGYSSLSYLRRFPLDALKLDRSFISEVSADPRMSQVVSSIVDIAHALDMRVVGEGIETPEQLSMLRKLRCDVGQGYHFSRPLPGDRTCELLKDWKTLSLIPKNAS